MNSYNGFTPAERLKAYAWLKEQWRTGKRPEKPKKCDGCGQEESHLEWHSEDYSFPYGDHIGQYGLCYVCHMMIHCRFRSPKAWEQYKERINKGQMPRTYTSRNWPMFRAEFLQKELKDQSFIDAPEGVKSMLMEVGHGREEASKENG